MFAELLGPLFIHPSRLVKETLLGTGAYATVHKARCAAIHKRSQPSASNTHPCRQSSLLSLCVSYRLSPESAARDIDSAREPSSEPVAVKQLKPEVLNTSVELKDFLLEANILRKLQHGWVTSTHTHTHTYSVTVRMYRLLTVLVQQSYAASCIVRVYLYTHVAACVRDTHSATVRLDAGVASMCTDSLQCTCNSNPVQFAVL